MVVLLAAILRVHHRYTGFDSQSSSTIVHREVADLDGPSAHRLRSAELLAVDDLLETSPIAPAAAGSRRSSLVCHRADAPETPTPPRRRRLARRRRALPCGAAAAIVPPNRRACIERPSTASRAILHVCQSCRPRARTDCSAAAARKVAGGGSLTDRRRHDDQRRENRTRRSRRASAQADQQPGRRYGDDPSHPGGSSAGRSTSSVGARPAGQFAHDRANGARRICGPLATRAAWCQRSLHPRPPVRPAAPAARADTPRPGAISAGVLAFARSQLARTLASCAALAGCAHDRDRVHRSPGALADLHQALQRGRGGHQGHQRRPCVLHASAASGPRRAVDRARSARLAPVLQGATTNASAPGRTPCSRNASAPPARSPPARAPPPAHRPRSPLRVIPPSPPRRSPAPASGSESGHAHSMMPHRLSTGLGDQDRSTTSDIRPSDTASTRLATRLRERGGDPLDAVVPLPLSLTPQTSARSSVPAARTTRQIQLARRPAQRPGECVRESPAPG